MASHGQTMFYLERLQFDWLPRKRRQTVSGYIALFVGALGALGFELLSWRFGVPVFGGLVDELIFRPYASLSAGLFVGACVFFTLDFQENIVCVESVRWSGLDRVLRNLN